MQQHMPAQQTTVEIRLGNDGVPYAYEVTVVQGYDGVLERPLGPVTVLRAKEHTLGVLAQLEQARATVAACEQKYAAALEQEQRVVELEARPAA
jgi:hypothetical protein